MKIGLPKGNVISNAQRIITSHLGREIDEKTLHHYSEDTDIHFYLMKPRDIPYMVHSETLDAGITFQEWVAEKDLPLHICAYLDWCTTRVSLLTPPNKRVIGRGDPVTCVTEFPHLAREFFRQNNIETREITQLSGSCEGMVPTIYDCAVDCVETGKSAQLHGLTEEAVLVRSQTVLVTKHKHKPLQLHNALKEFAL